MVLGAAILTLDLPLCPTRHLFGIPCPGCGLTRATLALFRGELAAAMALHPMVLVILPILGWMLLRACLVSAGFLGRTSIDPLSRVPRAGWLILVVVMLGIWTARLSGGLGGHPDPLDPSQGLFARVVRMLP